jgi:hypothetical protein
MLAQQQGVPEKTRNTKSMQAARQVGSREHAKGPGRQFVAADMAGNAVGHGFRAQDIPSARRGNTPEPGNRATAQLTD